MIFDLCDVNCSYTTCILFQGRAQNYAPFIMSLCRYMYMAAEFVHPAPSLIRHISAKRMLLDYRGLTVECSIDPVHVHVQGPVDHVACLPVGGRGGSEMRKCMLGLHRSNCCLIGTCCVYEVARLYCIVIMWCLPSAILYAIVIYSHRVFFFVIVVAVCRAVNRATPACWMG